MKIPRLAVFDLDGTLTESKQRMSAEMGELLSQLLTRIPVAIMSGGSWKQFQNQFLPNFSLENNLDRLYLFPENAALCFVHRSGAWHPQYDNSFSAAEKARIMQALKESLAEVKFAKPARLWGEQIEDRGAEITFSALGQEAPLEEKEAYDPTKEKRMPLANALKKRLPDLQIGVNAATSIDITPHGIDKAYGVKRLVGLTGIPPSDMLYVGDALEEGGNDAAVIKTGIPTHQVFGPEETATLIRALVQKAPAIV